MKNFFKLLGIIALVAVIGFSMAACGGDDDNSNNNSNNNNNTGGGSSGLNIESIPASVTGYIIAQMGGGKPPLYFMANDPYEKTYANQKAAAIANGKATLNAYYNKGTYSKPDYVKFTESATYTSISGSTEISTGVWGNDLTFYVCSQDNTLSTAGAVTNGITATYKLKDDKTLQFTNGKATLNWADLEVKN